MKDLAVLRLTREEFERLAECCTKDHAFPKTWEAWQATMEVATQQALAAGLDHPPLQLDIEIFESWCRDLQVIPCLDALRAYAIIKRSRASQSLATGDWPSPKAR